MRDFDGKTLSMGDKVITTLWNGRSGSYGGLFRGRVVGFTDKCVKIELLDSEDPFRNRTQIRKDPSTLAKYEWEDAC